MNDVLNDIEVIEQAIIAFKEGASDEKRSGYAIIERMIEDKKNIVETFEKEMAPKYV